MTCHCSVFLYAFHFSISFAVVSRPQAICRFLFNGPTKEGNELLLELTNRTKPVDNKVKALPFDQFQTTGDWLVPRGLLYYSAKGSWAKGLNALFGCVYLTVIPRGRMGSESIAHEVEGRMGY